MWRGPPAAAKVRTNDGLGSTPCLLAEIDRVEGWEALQVFRLPRMRALLTRRTFE
jgi:hypothetical protein